MLDTLLRVSESPTLAAVVAASLLVVWYVGSSIRAWHRLREAPGPFLGRFSYVWIAYHILKGDVKEVMGDLHDKYGPVVRIGPNQVITSDPEVLRTIASARTRYLRPDWNRGGKFHAEYENLFTIIDNEEHDIHKAKTIGGYSGREMGSQFEPAVDAEMNSLIALIRRKFLSDEKQLRPMDVSEVMRYLTMDVITHLGYGKSFGHLNEGSDVYGWVASTGSYWMMTLSLFIELPLTRGMMFSKYSLGNLGPKFTDESGPGKIMGVIHDLVSERFRGDSKPRGDMVNAFIRNGLTQEEIEGEAMLQIVAGSDTTTNVLSATLMQLVSSPHAYSRLKREIHDAIASGNAPADGVISYQQALKLPYLQGVVWEGFRSACAVVYSHYKEVPSGGDTFHGVFLPEGTNLGHNSGAMTRRPDIFGQDVAVFRPERFSDVDEATRATRIRALDIIFGGGRWMCSGKTVAMYEMNKTIFELMKEFDIQLLRPEKGWKEWHYVTPKFEEMMVIVTEADKTR
ncbi:putative cytochrome P450 E-class, group I [Cladorrhinum sp. PSN332]|nr:putative cytochrome P450 E-class, group I [Cladorrhinum sp. PSN332]